ncbi:MAG: hypothetical protein CM1200mP34_0670 [Verrucomicrobiales bacterium]|nr:MAG: hypothetical protein CM1200mP34_0670 [Verrucomicrobiales bacterium]
MPNASQSTGRKNDSPAASALSVFSQAGIGSDATGRRQPLRTARPFTRSLLFCPIRNAPRREGGQANTRPCRKSIPESAPHHCLLPLGTVSRQSRRRWCCPTRSPPCCTVSMPTTGYCCSSARRNRTSANGAARRQGARRPRRVAVRLRLPRGTRGDGAYPPPKRPPSHRPCQRGRLRRQTHWYIFLFEVLPRLAKLPPPCPEGRFGFFNKPICPGSMCRAPTANNFGHCSSSTAVASSPGHCHSL